MVKKAFKINDLGTPTGIVVKKAFKINDLGNPTGIKKKDGIL